MSPAARRAMTTALLPIWLSVPATGQEVRLGAFGVVVIENEDRAGEETRVGAGAQVHVEHQRLQGWLSAFRAPPTGDEAGGSVAQIDGAIAYKLQPFLFVEAGAGYRFASPDSAAPDVSWGRGGFRLETELVSTASVWGRGSLMASQPSGGAGALGGELGFGVRIDVLLGRVGGFLDYHWQQYDLKADLELSYARLGLALRL